MTDRTNALSKLAVGDIFHAQCPNGASLICLVESVTDTTIQARTVTHQIRLEFDRGTGIESGRKGETPCAVDSITPLPYDLHNVILGMDRKMRLEPDLAKHRLNDEEKRALVFIASFYPSNPL
jgi:hypothetical protein